MQGTVTVVQGRKTTWRNLRPTWKQCIKWVNVIKKLRKISVRVRVWWWWQVQVCRRWDVCRVHTVDRTWFLLRVLSIQARVGAAACRELRMSEASLLVSMWVFTMWTSNDESRLSISQTGQALSRVWWIQHDPNKSTQSIDTFGTIIESQVPQLNSTRKPSLQCQQCILCPPFCCTFPGEEIYCF